LPTFYANQISNKEITLDENDSRHAIKSLRLKVNDTVKVVSGNGELFITSIIESHPKKTVLSIQKRIVHEKETPLILAFAPTKNNDRNEWIIEKGIEIGMTLCIPIYSQNSERRKWNSDRMKKISIAAMKQSGRYWLPEINDPVNFNDFIISQQPDFKFIAHCKQANKQSLKKLAVEKAAQLILIGPEGDFTKQEIELAKANKFKEITLGNNRLRTETACLVALSLLKTS
jgi:16S rRNA (uracil1498-N3)-methyltransferase